MELWEAKMVSILALGIGTVFVGLLPAWFTKNGRQQWPLLLSSLLCFGGGVLLSTSIVHMLPEIRQTLPEYKEYSELIFCAGFFILYLIDEIVHVFYGETEEANYMGLPKNKDGRKFSERRFSCKDSCCSNLTSPRYGAATFENSPLLPDRQLPYNPSFYKARSDSELFIDGRVPSQLCHVAHEEPCSNSLPVANFGLLIALSIHALLEGLVVGLESETSKVLLLLGAIASHKLVVGFCLGAEIASNPLNSFCRHIVCIIIFTFGSIGGIALGMVVSNVPSGFSKLAIPILQGLAGGTLLYVTVSEIIPRERARWHQQHSRKHAGIYQFISVCLGFCIMASLTKYLDNGE